MIDKHRHSKAASTKVYDTFLADLPILAEHTTLVDRYIPPRKNHPHPILLAGVEDENQPPKSQSQSRLNKLYIKHVLNGYKGSLQDQTEISHQRHFPKTPYKVLDAPALQDDFYLNLIDWSQSNLLSVGLGSCVYLWSPSGGKVHKLCQNPGSNPIASVGWSKNSHYLGVGTYSGEVQLWDIKKMVKVRVQSGHNARTSSIAWADSHQLSTGSRDTAILHRDIRKKEPFYQRLEGHKQQVCGLKWSDDKQQLCSGGNDNKLFVWSNRMTNPIFKFNEHVAAVKALAWSPHQHGLLASGGGSADKKICFWNTTQGQLLKSVDTGSQVCNLCYSKNSRQLISTHGYSQNDICLWDKEMNKLGSLTGHTYRVLFLAMNPAGTDIVTGAGDETLRFWKIFDEKKSEVSGSGLGMGSVSLR